MENIQPIVPEGTPLPPAPVGVPPFPITPFSVWTWNTPVIPEFYWNIYSSEQRIKSICKEIGKIEAYLNYLANKTNENVIELHKRIDQLTERVATLENHVEEEVARLDQLIAQLRADLTQEIKDRQDADTALGDRIDQEIDDRQHADQVLHEEIAQEVEDRIHGDDQLHAEIAAEATSRAHGDEALHSEISQETQDRIHADSELETKLEAELQAEADMREEGDSSLRSALTTEETERKAADASLGQRITQETSDREAADSVLETKIATEAHEREAGDDQLASDLESEVSAREAGDATLRSALTTEEGAREAADAALDTKIAKRLLPSEVLAGNEIEITKDPNSNEITISSTVAHSIDNLENLITSLQAALTAETAERRADDGALWTAVNERIERGKILAGAGIKVENDPDSSTVTISGTSTIEGGAGIKVETEGDATTVSLATPYPTVHGTAPVTVDATSSTIPGAPATGTTYTVGVSTATESEAGIISEARVKELAGTVAPSLSAKSPLKLEDGTLSATPYPVVEGEGPVKVESRSASRPGAETGMTYSVGVDAATETEAGVITEARVKELIAEAIAAALAKEPNE